MAVSRETLLLVDGMRIAINAPVDAAARRVIDAWARAWTEVAREWDDAIRDLVDASKDGRWPSRMQVARAQRARAVLAHTRDMLDDLAKSLPVTVVQDVPHLAGVAAKWQARLMASQLPPQAGGATELVTRFQRVGADQVDQIVTRTTRRVTSKARPLSAQADAAMRSALIRGVAVGDNPRRAAADMLARVQGAFNGGRNRALVIARTEILDAYRRAAAANDKANSDVLAGWQWVADLGPRTCPSCFAMHGSMHPIDEPGPSDHQQGRCVRVPVTKPWKDLGLDVVEPASVLTDGRAVFDAMPEVDQLAVMGRDRLDLLRSGRIGWDDLAMRRRTPGWRDSWAPTPIQALRRKAA